MAGRFARWLWGADVTSLRPWRLAPASLGLLVGIIVVFVIERLSGAWHADVTDMRHLFGYAEPEISNGQIWRLVTSGFLHSDEPSDLGPYGFEHLLWNGVLLVVATPRLECRIGWRALLGFVVALQVVSFSAWAWHDDPVYFGVGASGWLSGIAGALLVDAVRRRAWLYAAAAVVWVGGFLLDPGISRTSEQVHVFGLVGGALVGLVGMSPRSTRVRPQVLAAVAVIALVPIGWHAATIDERPAVEFGRPAIELPCDTQVGRPRPDAEGALELLNETDANLYLMELTDGGARALMVLHPNERIVGGFRVGDRVRVERADGGCIAVVEVDDRPSTLRV